MRMNEINDKQGAWGDVEIYIGGRKIESIKSVEISINGSEEAGVLIDNKIHSYTGTITLSKRRARQLRKICMVKKIRLPRKLKKKLKKQYGTKN